MRPPDEVAGPYAPEVDRPVGKPQLAPLADAVDAAALLPLLRAAPVGGVEHHPVARLARHVQLDDHRLGQHLLNRPQPHPAMPRRPPLHHRLMVRPGEEERAEPPRIGLFEQRFLPGDVCPVHRHPVRPRRQRHVGRVFVPAFDLQRAYPGGDHLRHLFERVQVARRKQIPRLAERRNAPVHYQFIRQTAGLRALSPVGAAPAPRL